MAAGTVSSDIFAKCLPAINQGHTACAGITLCDLSPITVSDYDSIFQDEAGRWRPLKNLLLADFEGKSCQVKRNGLYDFLAAFRRPILSGVRANKNASRRDLMDVEPFLIMDRMSPINNDHWTATNGSDAGGTINGSAYDYVVDLTSQGGIPADAAWWGPRDLMTVFGVGAGGTTLYTCWKVVTAEAISATTIRVYATEQNTGLPSPAATRTAPTTGWAMKGVPWVGPGESYCHQIPALNPKQKALFWIGHTRKTICDDELTQKLKQLLFDGNEEYREFLHVSSVEYNRQVLQDFQRAQAVSFFFNPPLVNQTATGWPNLAQFNVWSDNATANGGYLYLPFEGMCQGRIANPVGQFWQLWECDRVFEGQNMPFNLFEVIEEIKNMWRVRKSNNLPSDVFEIIVPMAFATPLETAFHNYINAHFPQDVVRYNIDLKPGREAGPLGTYYRKFLLADPPVEVRVVSSVEFDDLFAAATAAGVAQAGAWALVFCWETMWEGIIASKKYNRVSGSAEEVSKVNREAMCVDVLPKQMVTLLTKDYTIVNECPESSAWYTGFRTDVPVEWRGEYGSIAGFENPEYIV